jgi:hypothetical protein
MVSWGTSDPMLRVHVCADSECLMHALGRILPLQAHGCLFRDGTFSFLGSVLVSFFCGLGEREGAQVLVGCLVGLVSDRPRRLPRRLQLLRHLVS